jgi:hypothetical protein
MSILDYFAVRYVCTSIPVCCCNLLFFAIFYSIYKEFRNLLRNQDFWNLVHSIGIMES